MVYHEQGGQRFGLRDNLWINLNGLARQYGVMGMKCLAGIHNSAWHNQFFEGKFQEMVKMK